MNEQLSIGTLNTLRVSRQSEPGIYLADEEGTEVLLPNRYVTDAMEPGSELDVFVYTDSEDRPVATTETPKAKLGEFGWLRIVDITAQGIFLDWGLPKDLFVPRTLQKRAPVRGEQRLVFLIKDSRSERIVGTEKVSEYLRKAPATLYPNSTVTLLILDKTPLGYKAIVNDAYEGLLYHTEIFEALTPGERRTGYVKQVRKDGKVDLLLRPMGASSDTLAQEKLLELLDANNGSLPYNYKSDPELVKKVFGLSKKQYKRTLTALQEAGHIAVKENGIFRVTP